MSLAAIGALSTTGPPAAAAAGAAGTAVSAGFAGSAGAAGVGVVAGVQAPNTMATIINKPKIVNNRLVFICISSPSVTESFWNLNYSR
jgi:hypothetical protein